MIREEMGEEKRGGDRRRIMCIRRKWVKRNRGETDRGKEEIITLQCASELPKYLWICC